MYKKIVQRLRDGLDLNKKQIKFFLDETASERLPLDCQAEILKGIEAKGVTARELGDFVSLLKQKSAFTLEAPDAIDLCGTGGSGLARINTSTIAAFVVAACGVKVAKHGNKAASGRCGSFDLLERLGVAIDPTSSVLKIMLEREGLAFIFARAAHPVMKHFAPVRELLKSPTLFNRLGPLLNPANPKRQIIGVAQKKAMDLMAEACQKLRKKHVFIVRGQEGLDEVTLTGKTDVIEVAGIKISRTTLTPKDFGIESARPEEITGGSIEKNAALAESILKGTCRSRHLDLVLVNAALALTLAEKAATLKEGIALAREAIQSGRAFQKLERIRQLSRTPSILLEIAAHKKIEVAQRKQKIPLALIQKNLTPSSRNFKNIFRKNTRALIAEIKQASPSAGQLRDGVIDVGALASRYESADADAISVVTDSRFFKGSLKNLAIARQSTKAIPLLCKDFILDSYQIYEARAHGADAILLIAALLTQPEIEDFLRIARNLKMACVVEAHDRNDLETILKTSASIIGINRRNLHTFVIDPLLHEALVPRIPEDKIIILESGFSGASELGILPRRVQGVLVGTSIMRHPHPELKIKEFKGKKLLKCCGIRRLREAKFCEKNGVDFIGLNFVPTSRRRIDMATAVAIGKRCKTLKKVGVFQDQPLSFIRRLARTCSLDYVQLSGSETISFVKKCNRPVIKGISIRSEADLERARQYRSVAAYLLLDNPKPGNGDTSHHALIRKADFPFILAGGVTPKNAPELLATLKPLGLDVASGIETDGVIDFKKIIKLIPLTTPPMISLKKIVLNRTGHFGPFGGRYIPELLIPVMESLEKAFYQAIRDPLFLQELKRFQNQFAGRPTPLYFCENLTRHCGGARIYLKNEGLLHTGAHKMNHALGQALLAKRLGKKRLIAETGAGQHGLATATVAAKFRLQCTIYMGARDYDRQRPNVFWMERLGAEVIPVKAGGQILRDAISEALRDLMSHPEETHYLLGTVCGPHPYPVMNAYFQSIIGKEVRRQMQREIGQAPDTLVACLGGGSNAIGLFYEFLDDPDVKMIAVEAGGRGIQENEQKCAHAARFQTGHAGVVEGFKSIFLQDPHGQIKETHSISAGLDYSGVGPQIAYLHSIGRIQTTFALDQDALRAYELVAKTEGIILALESAHAAAEAIRLAPTLGRDQTIVFNASGRGDKDLFITADAFDPTAFKNFLTHYLHSHDSTDDSPRGRLSDQGSL